MSHHIAEARLACDGRDARERSDACGGQGTIRQCEGSVDNYRSPFEWHRTGQLDQVRTGRWWLHQYDSHSLRANCYRLPGQRSEEHTSELQSLRHLVCRIFLEKKKIPGSDAYPLNYGAHGANSWTYVQDL